jgi:hypothetical protein
MPECAESGTMRAKATAQEEEEERRLSAAAPTCDKPLAIAKLKSTFAITVAMLGRLTEFVQRSRKKNEKKTPRTASCWVEDGIGHLKLFMSRPSLSFNHSVSPFP